LNGSVVKKEEVLDGDSFDDEESIDEFIKKHLDDPK
jgi:hypothetical protein